MKPLLAPGIGFVIGAIASFWLAQNYLFDAGELRRIPSLRLADGGVYSGRTDADGLLSGNGQLDYPNGNHYSGEFQDGLYHGEGKYSGANGMVAEGDFRQGLLQGYGRVEYSGGTYYEGEFHQNLRHGQGKLVNSNGNSWEGAFDADQMTGSGVWSEANGTIYRGEMKAGKFQGHGEITYPDKSRYVGQFRQGNRHGQGVFTRPDGTQYSGDFIDDEFTGSGSISWPGERGEYVGAVATWQPHGKGITTNRKDRQLIGNYVDGSLSGEGEYRGPGGLHYQGEFEEGRYSGKGVFLDSDGNRYEGEFKHNQFHGEGQYTYAEPVDGITTFTGTWAWGQLVSGDKQLVIHAPEQISEHFLYQQTHKLTAALSTLTSGDPEKIELYTLALGAFGDQEVFNREINYIERQFKVNYDTEGRGLYLSNSRRNIDARPMATTTSLQRGIDAMAAAMNLDQDILFLYLTTHGSAEHVLSFDQSGMDLPDLSADELGEMLDNSGIKWKVVVISACYSGGFIDRLKSEHTLIFTAAAADKTSFGCDDNHQFTYFGDAFFRQSLTANHSFSDAFDEAVKLIAQWELDENLDPSNPQSHQPVLIREQLALWRKQLGKSPFTEPTSDPQN